MSHNLIFARYVNRERVPFELEKLKSILVKHGCKVSSEARKIGRSKFENICVLFPVHDDGDDIGGDEGGIIVTSEGAIEFAVGRPLYYERLRNLSFELLQSLDLCMHPDFGEEVFSTRQCEEHIPREILDTCGKGLQVVRRPADLW